MSVYTNLGSGLWSWEPFRRLERHHEDITGRCAKLLWIALYTTPEAKMAVPGMFIGSVTTIAEAAHMPVDSVRTYLDRLIEDDLVEYDVERRVLRMTSLPDPGESPSNGRAIRGWWRRFETVPACAVRDAHVIVLRWILDEWSRRNLKAISNDHATAWTETFGRISVPPIRARAARHVQTSLFAPSGSADPKINKLDTNKGSTSVELDPDPDKDQDLRDQREGGSGGGEPAPGKKPVLLLVPHPAFDADDLAATLHKATGGDFPEALTKSSRIALGRAIDAIGEASLHPMALAALGEYVASLNALRGGAGMAKVSIELVTSPGWIAAAIKRGMEWVSRGETNGTGSVH